MKTIRVLTVGMTATAGGVENFLMSYLGRVDSARIRFDFLTRYADAAYPDQRAAIGKTYVIPQRSEDPVKYYREIRAFYEQHAKEYDVIWDNECMFNDMTPLKLAQEYGIPVRIAHSHMPQNMDPSLAGRGRGVLHRAHRRGLARYANVLWACSEESARWACPAMNLPVTIIPHAIDTDACRFSPAVREEVRTQYGLSDCLVVGQVGRLQFQKNQAFLLEAFTRLHAREPRARLMLVGDGPDLLELEAKAVDLGVEQAVLFLGHRDDVPRLLQAFDLFAAPSRFEGLGMTAVEAQAAGLPCLLSDAFPKTAAITGEVAFLAPEDPDLWAERMLDVLEAGTETVRTDPREAIVRAGYDLNEAAEHLTERFETLVRERPSFKRRFLLSTESFRLQEPLARKARQDVQRIATEAGFVPIGFPAEKKDQKWWQKAGQLGQALLVWGKLFFQLHHGDLLLVQYPWYPVKAAPIARAALHMVQWKGARTACFVHDLDSLSRMDNAAARWSDQELLLRFDQVIAQTDRMADYLIGQGLREEAVTPLRLFDRLTDEPIPERTLTMDVCIASSQGRKRNRYIQDLTRVPLNWHLYGSCWKGKSKQRMNWHGDQLNGLTGSFGLIWAGSSTRVITGEQGAYMMLSAPREASLYLSQGLPLIVWKWSALAEFVRENQVGLVVDSLADIPGALRALTAQEYANLAASARAWGEKLRRGDMTREALRSLR